MKYNNKRYNIIKLFLIAVIISFFTGCYYDNDEYLYPELNDLCNTDSVKYSSGVLPILENYCLSCHNNTNANGSGGGIKLGSYEDVLVYVQNGRFYGAVSHANGFSPMPKNSPALQTCYIDMIKSWIDNGSPNN